MQRVVITGLGAVTPVGNDVPSLWHGLVHGQVGIAPITRFDTAAYKVKLAAEVKDLDVLQHLSREQVRKTDLYTQYALIAAKEAVEDSGLLPHTDPARLGVYVGSGIGGLNTLTREADKHRERGPGRVSPFFIPMMIANMAAGHIAIAYHAQGPCLPVVTACATSTHAIGEAFYAIAQGRADAILAGGAEAAIHPLAVAGFTACMALTQQTDPARASIPFDARRDGFVMGEGAGIVVLESLSHAKARGAHIYCEVVGYGNTCDAYHPTAPDPSANGPARAIAQAYAPIAQSEGPLYVNAHGTSTPLNDKTETLSLKLALGESVAQQALISSTKSMTGHMLGAAGAVEAIACAKALSTGTVPPTMGYAEPDPDCDLHYVPGAAVQAHPTRALSVSLGFGGHNACLAFAKEDAQ